MNTKLANLLFEENNIKNISKIFENSIMFEDDQNNQENKIYLTDVNGEKTLLYFVAVNDSKDASKNLFFVFFVEKNESGKGSIICYKLSYIDDKSFVIENNVETDEIGFSANDFAMWSQKISDLKEIPIDKEIFPVRPTSKEDVDKAFNVFKTQEEAKKLFGNNISGDTVGLISYEGKKQPGEEEAVSDQSKKDDTASIDDENQQQSAFDQVFLKMNKLDNEAYEIRNVRETVVVEFNSPIEISLDDDNNVKLNYISFTLPQDFSDKKIILTLNCRNKDNKVVDLENPMNAKDLPNNLPEKLSKALNEAITKALTKKLRKSYKDEKEESNEDDENGTEVDAEESDDENAGGVGESNIIKALEGLDELINVLEDSRDNISSNVKELEEYKKDLDKISKEVNEDTKKQEIEELKVKLDKLIEDAKERETKVKSVQDLTESEKSNRKNALTIILQDVNRTIKSSKDENYKKEYEKELKLAKEKDLEDENATLVTGFTVGSVLSLALGLGVATAAAPVSGAVALSALAAGFVGMSPVGMAGAFLAKGKKGKETAASQVQPAKSYSADVAKDVEKLEKCVEVLVRQALRETKLIYKKGLRFLLEDIDDAESRRSKIKRYDQLEITKQDIKDTFVAEGFDFFIKNKKFLEKDQFEEFIDRLSSIFKVYHNIKVKDAVERDIAQETIASRKEEISIAARQLFNYIEANKQKIEQNFGQEASAQVEKLVSSATNKNVIANLPAPRLALQYSLETWAEEGIQGQGPYATVDPSDSEDDNWDSSSFDSLKSYDTEDTESSDEESSKETELNNSAFSGDFDEVDAEEESEESQQTTYENVDALASDIVKEVTKIKKQTQDTKDSIGKIYLSRNNDKAIVIYREKPKEDSDGFVAPIKIALIDKDISKEKSNKDVEIGNKYAIFVHGVTTQDDNYIKKALSTLKNLNDKTPTKLENYFDNTFVKSPNIFTQKTLKDIKFLSSIGDIQPLINNIDFEKKNTRSLTQQDSPKPRQSINNVNAPEEARQAIEDATSDLDLEEADEKTGLTKYVSQIDEIVQKNENYIDKYSDSYIKGFTRSKNKLLKVIEKLDSAESLNVSLEKGSLNDEKSAEGVYELISFADRSCKIITALYQTLRKLNDKTIRKKIHDDVKSLVRLLFKHISNTLKDKSGYYFVYPKLGRDKLEATMYYTIQENFSKRDNDPKVTAILDVCVTNGTRIRKGGIA